MEVVHTGFFRIIEILRSTLPALNTNLLYLDQIHINLIIGLKREGIMGFEKCSLNIGREFAK